MVVVAIDIYFIPDPHGIVAPKLIGEIYFGGLDTSANAGFIGSGFSQAGMMGVAAYAIGVGFLIAIFHTYGRYMGLPFMAALIIGPLLSMLRSTDFATLFLTHGMLLFLVLLLLLRSPIAEKTNATRKKNYMRQAPTS